MQKKHLIYNISILVLGLSLTIGATADKKEPIFPKEILTQYSSWEPVTIKDEAFKSEGHNGAWVHSYFNDVASPVYHKEMDIPFPEGSVLAKSMVRRKTDSSKKAVRIFLMKKMHQGYDTKNNDWAYGVAKKKKGKFKVINEGKIAMCINCHSKPEYQKYDLAKTLQVYWDGHQQVQDE